MSEIVEDDDDNYWDYLDEPDECDCSDYDVDLLEGRAWCMRCDRRWWLTNEQISNEIKHYAAMIECVEEEYEEKSP